MNKGREGGRKGRKEKKDREDWEDWGVVDIDIGDGVLGGRGWEMGDGKEGREEPWFFPGGEKEKKEKIGKIGKIGGIDVMDRMEIELGV